MSVNDAYRIVIDNSRVMLQFVASLTDDCRGIIYNCNVFIVEDTGCIFENFIRVFLLFFTF